MTSILYIVLECLVGGIRIGSMKAKQFFYFQGAPPPGYMSAKVPEDGNSRFAAGFSASKSSKGT